MKTGRKPLFEVDQVAEALLKCGGIYAQAARMLKCDRATIKEYIKRHPELEQVEEEARERSIDLAESVVMRQMQKENLTAAIFMLNTQGKKRGYSTKQDVEVTGEIKVVLQNDLADQDSEPV